MKLQNYAFTTSLIHNFLAEDSLKTNKQTPAERLGFLFVGGDESSRTQAVGFLERFAKKSVWIMLAHKPLPQVVQILVSDISSQK